MKHNKPVAESSTRTKRLTMHVRTPIVWSAALIGLLATATATAKCDEPASDPVTLGEPKVLYVADGDWIQGHFLDLAFTPDSKSIVATLERNPGSIPLFLLGNRVGEVRSFDVKANGQISKLLMTARNTRHHILTTPTGVCREPLLLARSYFRLKNKNAEVEVVRVQSTENGVDESLIGRFPIPRHEAMSRQASCSISLAVTPVTETLVLRTGCMDWKENNSRSPTWWGDVEVFDLGTGESRFADAWETNQVNAVSCSPDGNFIAAAGGHSAPTLFSPNRLDGRVVCWDDNFQERFDLTLPNHKVDCLVFSPDSNKLVTGGLDGRMTLIDMNQGVETKSLNIASRSGKSLGRVQSLAFSPNGTLLAVGTGSWNRGNKWGETFLVDLRNDEVHKVPSSEEDHVITCVAFSPDGKYLVTGGMAGILKLWRIDDGQ